MKPIYIALGVLCTAIWGFNFVVIKLALAGVPPLLLTAERFALAALPALLLARPAGLTWARIAGVGTFMFLGQYVFLFVAMDIGMPPGLASVTLQVQAFMTMLLAAFALGERPGGRQIAGAGLAFAGLAAIAATAGAGSDIPLAAIALIALSAASWAIGNVLLRQAGPAAGGGTLAGVAWLSLLPPLPALALSLAFEGPERVAQSLAHTTPLALAAMAYIVGLSTWVGFGIWGRLMALYPAGAVAPFTLLVPFFGAASAALVLGEQLTLGRLAGTALIVAGLAAITLPGRRPRPARAPPASPAAPPAPPAASRRGR